MNLNVKPSLSGRPGQTAVLVLNLVPDHCDVLGTAFAASWGAPLSPAGLAPRDAAQSGAGRRASVAFRHPAGFDSPTPEQA